MEIAAVSGCAADVVVAHVLTAMVGVAGRTRPKALHNRRHNAHIIVVKS